MLNKDKPLFAFGLSPSLEGTWLGAAETEGWRAKRNKYEREAHFSFAHSARITLQSPRFAHCQLPSREALVRKSNAKN